MKKYILAVFLTLALVNVNAQESTIKKDSIIILDSKFGITNTDPIPYLNGITIKSNCDTVYVINKLRFANYEAARRYIMNSRTNKELIAQYEKALNEQDKYYKELMKSYTQADSISQNLIKDTREDLQGVSANLKNACTSIDSVNTKLDDVQKLIKKQKWESLKQKLMVGFGGLGAGVLVGVIISK
ncbi:MAG: hypothetical protein ACT4ON_00995 [Bacteroidota bacterium]